jgi:hypothetical protein
MAYRKKTNKQRRVIFQRHLRSRLASVIRRYHMQVGVTLDAPSMSAKLNNAYIDVLESLRAPDVAGQLGVPTHNIEKLLAEQQRRR